MVEQWQYFLIIPESDADAADTVSSALGNPSGIRQTFSKWPPDEGTLEEPIAVPAQYWIASFLTFDLISQGNPSRQALEASLGQNPVLESLMWVRSKNPYSPETPENEHGVAVASNWAVFPVGGVADWAAVCAALEIL